RPDRRRLLRMCRKRPCQSNDSEQADEFASVHSITSSARASNFRQKQDQSLGGLEVDLQLGRRLHRGGHCWLLSGLSSAVVWATHGRAMVIAAAALRGLRNSPRL